MGRRVGRLPMLVQSERSDCALACLAMVAEAFGRPLDLEAAGHQGANSARGLGLADLLALAAGLGLVTRPLQASLDELVQLACPAILHWDLDHFVVLKKASRRRLVVHDPARGVLSLPLKEASRHFTGVAVELWPGDAFVTGPPAPRLRLADLVPPGAWLARGVVPVFALSLMLQGLLLAAPLYLQWVVDRALVAADLSLVHVLTLGFGVLLLFQTAVQAVRGWMLGHLSFSLGYQLSTRVMAHLLRLPYAWFGSRAVGDLVARFEALGPVRALLSETVVAALADGFMGVLALVLMFRYDAAMSAVVLTGLGAYLALRLALFPRARRLAAASLQAESEANATFVESLAGIGSIKALNLLERRQAVWQRQFSRGMSAGLALSHLETTAGSARALISGAEHLLVVWLGAHSVLEGGMSLGMLLAFLAYRTQFVNHSAELVERLIQARTVRVYLDRLRPICLSPAEPDPERPSFDVAAAPALGGELSVSGVGFRYGIAEPWVLQDVDLALVPGGLTVVMGPSGQGKTTLLKLLMGLLVPTCGELRLQSGPLMGARLGAYRREVAAVLQDDGLFAGSLLDNVAVGVDRPDAERAYRMLQLASLGADLDALPLGLGTLIGERGLGLSVGQRQRVLLARALYREPRWLFLDEPTASLDAASAEAVRQTLAALPMTRLVVTHDAGFVALADRLFSMEAGRLRSGVGPADGPVRAPTAG